MSKVVILGDLHLGARNGSRLFSEYFNSFFTEILWPYCRENNVKTILQLGDLFDNRTNLSYKAFHRSRDVWFGELENLGITYYTLLGNHDITYRHSLEINSPELLLGEFSNIKVVNKPTQIDIDGIKIDMVPWICDENEKDIVKFMKRKGRGEYLLGHFEIAGFAMYQGVLSHGGMSRDIFDNYPQVLSGHYHTRSTRGNILYTGIPYEITWSDYADPKGFHVLDTKTKELEFIRNPLTIFRKLTYDDGCPEFKHDDIKGKITRVYIQSKGDPLKYERWIDSVRYAVPFELNVVENTTLTGADELIDDDIDLADTKTLIGNYIDNLDLEVDKDKLKSFINTLHDEAWSLGDDLT